MKKLLILVLLGMFLVGGFVSAEIYDSDWIQFATGAGCCADGCAVGRGCQDGIGGCLASYYGLTELDKSDSCTGSGWKFLVEGTSGNYGIKAYNGAGFEKTHDESLAAGDYYLHIKSGNDLTVTDRSVHAGIGQYDVGGRDVIDQGGSIETCVISTPFSVVAGAPNIWVHGDVDGSTSNAIKSYKITSCIEEGLTYCETGAAATPNCEDVVCRYNYLGHLSGECEESGVPTLPCDSTPGGTECPQYSYYSYTASSYSDCVGERWNSPGHDWDGKIIAGENSETHYEDGGSDSPYCPVWRLSSCPFFDESLCEGLVLYLPFEGNIFDASDTDTANIGYYSGGDGIVAAEPDSPSGYSLASYSIPSSYGSAGISNNFTIFEGGGVAYGDVAFGQESFSVFTWIRSDFPDGGEGSRIINGVYYDHAYDGYQFLVMNDRSLTLNFVESIDSEGGAGGFVSGPVLDEDRWYHVGFVRDGSLLTLYVDGEAIGTSDTLSDWTLSKLGRLNAFVVGCDSHHPSRCYMGDMDEFSVWHRALSSDEVEEIYEEYFDDRNISSAEWQDLSGNPILSAQVGDTVKMSAEGVEVSGYNATFDIEIGSGSIWQKLLEFLRIVSGTETVFVASDTYVLLNDTEHTFTARISELGVGATSGPLSVSAPTNPSDPLQLDLISPSCGDDFTNSEEIVINVTLMDADDLVQGNVTIIDNFSNSVKLADLVSGFNSIIYTESTPGEYIIKTEASNSRGQYNSSSANIIVSGGTGNYTAACIDSPEPGKYFQSSSVNFTATSSKAIECFGGVCDFIDLTSNKLLFSWAFPLEPSINFEKLGDGTNISGSTGLTNPVEFTMEFVSSGFHPATLDLSFY